MIDVSMFQGHIDWAKVATRHKVAGIKATQGVRWTDPYFHANWMGAKAHGLLCMAYHFADPGDDAKAQARHFLTVARPILSPGNGIPVLDFEKTGGLTESQMVQWAKEWFSVIDPIVKTKSMLYTYSAFAPNFGPALIGHPLWIANYDHEPRTLVPAGKWPRNMVYIHQYDDKGKCPGIDGAVDLDYRYVSIGKLRIPKPSPLSPRWYK